MTHQLSMLKIISNIYTYRNILNSNYEKTRIVPESFDDDKSESKLYLNYL